MVSLNLPKGLVPLDDEVTELGHNKATGFMWIIRNNRKEHVFKGLGGKVYFDTEVTAFLEDRKMKQVHGVKSKELFITFTIREIYVTDPASDKITFGTAAGITKAQPRSAFEL